MRSLLADLPLYKIGDSHGAKPFVKINLTEYLSHFYLLFRTIQPTNQPTGRPAKQKVLHAEFTFEILLPH